jgi:acyl-CoA synthetase (AMP-forming)/AMP-acid ligase II/thioesterase domain-containing protein
MDTLDFQARCITETLRKYAIAAATSPAIVGSDGKSLSYQALLHQVENIGALLAASGVSAQDRVAMVATTRPDMIVAFLGIASVAACAPLNPSYTAAEFAFFLGDLRPRLLIVEAGLAPQVRDVAQGLGIAVWEFAGGAALLGGLDFPGRNPTRAAVAPAPATTDSVALILHTSGTTSRHKMVPLTQGNLCCSASNIARSLDLSPSDCCLSVMPLFHIHGLVGTVLSTLASGGSVKCAGAFTAASLLDGLRGLPPTWYSAVPAMHEAVLSAIERSGSPLPPHRLRFIRSCSAALPPRTLARLEECLGVPVVEAYGMTEASHQIAINPLPPKERKPGSVGVATGTEIAIASPDGGFLELGKTGEIVIRGGGVTGGYIGDAGASENSFFGGWLRTGDLGRIDGDGYLFISGRIKEIINRGGEKIVPREIEEVLLSYPGIAEAVAFAVPDERLGEVVGVAIVTSPGAKAPTPRSLREFAAAQLAAFKLPRHIVFVGEIPRGSTGKPQRIGLAARLIKPGPDRSPEGPEAAGAPGTELEAMLVEIWSKTLELQTVGLDDDFFLSGGDSLSAQTMLSEIEAQQSVALTIADLLNAPTISLLAELIIQGPARDAPARVAVIQPGKSRPPFFCIGAGPRFRELARLLGKDRPFIAPIYPAPAALPFPCGLEDIARYHVHSIRDVQPAGPYFLGGWCIDGMVAYEVAQQLKAAGELVALLVLFDTGFNFDFDGMSIVTLALMRLQTAVFSLAFHVRTACKQPSLRDFLQYVRIHLWRVADRIRYRYLYLCFRLRRGKQQDDDWRKIAAIQQRVSSKYKPQPYDGEVLLLRRSVRSRFETRMQQFWRKLTGGTLEFHQIPGDHGDMFDHPQVAVTAEKLRVKLGEARDTPV